MLSQGHLGVVMTLGMSSFEWKILEKCGSVRDNFWSRGLHMEVLMDVYACNIMLDFVGLREDETMYMGFLYTMLVGTNFGLDKEISIM